MKILVIHGSMRKGTTYALTTEVTNRLATKTDVEIIEFSVADLDLPFCCSCNNCFSKGEEYCPHFSITKEVGAALAACDGVILSGVTYMWALNAAMKNLLDHFAYLFHRPSLFGKQGMVITTAAGVGEKSVAKYLKTVLGQWGINGAIAVTQTAKEHSLQSSGTELSSKETMRIDKAAEEFYDNIKSQRCFSPSMKNIAVHNAFRAMSLGGFSGSELDKQFWSKDGYLNKSYPVKIGVFKRATGSFVYQATKQVTDIVGRIYTRRQKRAITPSADTK
ncbi:hypothetical protein FACS18948_5770 [Clostridia bacterium]|nr:hypothetical protein FACS18948_5770 [Clostridia bacterium]